MHYLRCSVLHWYRQRLHTVLDSGRTTRRQKSVKHSADIQMLSTLPILAYQQTTCGPPTSSMLPQPKTEILVCGDCSHCVSITTLNIRLVGSLTNDMELFGGEHSDHKDCAVSYFCMQVISKLPDADGWQGGRFHLLALGFYARLVRWRAIFFSGRLRHSSTSPLAPKSEKAPAGTFRVVP